LQKHFGDAGLDMYRLLKRWQPLMNLFYQSNNAPQETLLFIPVTPMCPVWNSTVAKYCDGWPALGVNSLSFNGIMFREWVGKLRYRLEFESQNYGGGFTSGMGACSAFFMPFLEQNGAVLQYWINSFYANQTGRALPPAGLAPMFYTNTSSMNRGSAEFQRWSTPLSWWNHISASASLQGMATELAVSRTGTALEVTVPFFDNHRVELTQRYMPFEQSGNVGPYVFVSSMTGYLIIRISNSTQGAARLLVAAGDDFQYSVPMGGTSVYICKQTNA